MATLTGVSNEVGPATENGEGPMSSLAATQKGVFEMSTVISQPGLKGVDSSEILHLPIHQCARDGNPENMQRLLASFQSSSLKKKVNAHDEEDLSALHYAASYNHVEIVKLLVEHQANVNDVDKKGATPLHFAARYSYKRVRLHTSAEPSNIDSTVDNSVVLYLVSKGARMNAQDIYGCPPLHFAAMRGNELVTYELLSCKGINIEAVDKQNMTALHQSAFCNKVEVCRMLIEKGAELCCVDQKYSTPLHYAAMEDSEDIAKMLFEAAEKKVGWMTVHSMVSGQNKQKNTPLHLAALHRSCGVAQLCLEKGSDVNQTNDQYSTPLHLAATTGELRMVELLLGNKARINALDYNQSTPLHKAAEYDRVDVIEYLIRKELHVPGVSVNVLSWFYLPRGARIDKQDKNNVTPLLMAASNGQADTINTLFKNGASIWDVDKNDKTVLYLTAEVDNVEALVAVLEEIKEQDAGEIIDKGDRYDNTPLHIAAQKGYTSCVKNLLEGDADCDARNEKEQIPLHLAAKHGKTGVVKLLVNHDLNAIYDEDEDSNTALHLASLAGHNKVVTALLVAGADIEARNCSLWTPLDCAAAKGWAKTCKILLENDTSVDPLDKTKTTPLHLACSRGHVQCVNILLQWHANVSLTDTDENNCLDMAIDNGHKDVANAILSSDKWKEALRNDTRNIKDGTRNTPMRKLVKKMPDVAKNVFTRCMSFNVNNPDDPNYTITFNYEFLDDMYSDWGERDGSDSSSTIGGSVYDDDEKLLETARPYTTDGSVLKKNHPLMLMVNGGQEDLLAHPLVTSLLRHKWKSYGRWFYYTNLIVYTIFLIFLTGYICTTKPTYMYYDFTMENCTADSCSNIKSYCTVDDISSIAQSLFAYIGKYVIMALAALNILREIIQILTARLNYVGWENLIEWIIYVSSLLLVIDFNKCQQETGIREVWQWQLASVAILLAWLELVLFIRKLPRFGIFVVMVTVIFKTFLLFAPVFFLFVIAFAMAFYVLLANQVRFRGVEYSLISTTVMMIGEMDYTDLFFGTEGEEAGTDGLHKAHIYYQGITYPVFVIFIVLLTILIMNLLIGLAVDDIKGVQEQAVLKRLAMQVELALDVESLLPEFIRRRFVIRAYKLQPNKPSKNPLQRLLNLESSFMSSQALPQDDIGVMMEKKEKKKDQITQLRQKMKSIYQQNLLMESMLTQLMKAQDVEFNEENANEEDMNLVNVNT